MLESFLETVCQEAEDQILIFTTCEPSFISWAGKWKRRYSPNIKDFIVRFGPEK
jgi:hypothetical protein